MFRLFISSTFSDMHRERDALQKRVFPRLAALCEQRGARFMPVDLRWGVTEAAAQGQQTMRICLEEIARCQRTTVRPNFVALLGNRYGWRPLPVEIPVEDYADIRRAIREAGGRWRETQGLLDRWFGSVDENAVPPVHVLRRRSASPTRWQRIELTLGRLLREATVHFEESRRVRYVASSTEQEIIRGALLPGTTIDHAVCFLREIHGSVPRNAAVRSRFIDVDERSRPVADAAERLNALKQRIERRLGAHVFHYDARWQGNGITREHLSRFVDDAYAALSRLILRELEGATGQEDSAQEQRAHEDFARNLEHDRGATFVGRRDALASIERYVTAATPRPLVVFGSAGVGKTALMARAALEARERHSEAVVVQRFIGATPESTNVPGLLRSLGRELAEHCPGEGLPAAGDTPTLAGAFDRMLERARAGRRLVIFVDAVDQLQGSDETNVLWLPAQLAANVRLIASMSAGAELTSLTERTTPPLTHELRPMGTAEAHELLDRWLAGAGRTLRPRQREVILRSFRRHGLPLYLRLAFEQARTWHSDERPRIEPTVARVLGGLFGRLAHASAHGRMLVERAIGYLVSARNGVAEDEMAALLSRDRVLKDEFRRRSPESPRTRTLPPIVWSRLYFDLEPYLTTHVGDGTSLLDFRHRELHESAHRRFPRDSSGRPHHQRLAAFFNRQPLQWNDGGAESVGPNRRKLAELPFQLARLGRWRALRLLVADYTFLETKIRASGPQSVIEDIALFRPASRSDTPHRPPQDLMQLRDAIRLSAQVVQQRPEELGAQLTGRLLDSPFRTLRQVVSEATHDGDRDTFRPLRVSLAAPGVVLTSLQGHRAYVGCLAVTPDGACVVSGSDDNTVRIWNLTRVAASRELVGHRNRVAAVAVAPDGNLVVSGSLDKTIRIWDLRIAGPPTVLRLGAQVTSLAMFDDGRRFAAAVGNRIQIRTLPSGRLERWSGRSRNQVWSIAVSPGGDRIAGISTDGLLRVWQVGEAMPPIVFHATDPGEPEVFEIRDEIGSRGSTLRWEIYGQPAWSADGRFVYAPSNDYDVRGRDVSTGGPTAKLHGHTNTVNTIAVAPGGGRAASASNDGTIGIWDLASGKATAMLAGHSDSVQGVAFLSDADTIVSASGDGTLRVWDLKRAPSAPKPDHPRKVTAVAVSASRLVSVCEWHGSSTVRFWDRNGRPLRTLDTKERFEALAVSPDGRRLFGAGMGLHLMDLAGKSRWRYMGGNRGSGHGISALAVTPDGRYLIDAGWEGARLWDLATVDLTEYKRLASVKCLGDLHLYTFWLAVSPDSEWVFGSHKEGIRMVRIESRAEHRTIHERDRVLKAIVTRDGQQLLATTESGLCKFWRLTDLKCVRVHERDYGGPVGFTPDGQGVVSVKDRTIVWWEVESGEIRATFTVDGSLTACALSPDGATVIAGEQTGCVHVLRRHGGRMAGVAGP